MVVVVAVVVAVLLRDPLTATAQKTTENNNANDATCSVRARLKNKSAKLEKALLLPPVVRGYNATAATTSGMLTAECTRLIVGQAGLSRGNI